jgi:hypothetical protein
MADAKVPGIRVKIRGNLDDLPNLDLGKYIFAANPYKAGRPPEDTWCDWPPAPVVKLVADDCDDADAEFLLDASGAELQERPGNWKFKYAEHYVRRAIRMPYLYYQVSDTDPTHGTLVKDYFLIGFEGGGAY